MNNLIVREWNQQEIRQLANGYISATDMCSVFDKSFKDWFANKKTQEFLEALSYHINLPVKSMGENPPSPQPQGFQALVNTIKGGNPQDQGTWIHPDVAMELSRWLSPEFGIQCNQWVKELLETGKVELQSHPEQDSLDVLSDVVENLKYQRDLMNQQQKELENHNERIDQNATEIEALKDAIEENQNNPSANNLKLSLRSYVTTKGFILDKTLRGVGRMLTKLCEILKIDYRVTPVGSSNEYPYWLLETLFDTAEDFDCNMKELLHSFLKSVEE